MPSMKITEKAIDRLKAPTPTGKQILYWDETLRGFGVLCSGATSAKSFVCQREINGKTRRVTIGPTNVLSLQDARKRAEGVLAKFYAGVDPKAGVPRTMTLAEVLEGYIKANPELRAKTIKDYRFAVGHYLAAWADKPLSDITSRMVEDRHREIRDEVAAANGGRYDGEGTANNAIRTLKALWNYAATHDEDLPRNPVRLAKKQWFKISPRERIVPEDKMPSFYAAVQALASPVARDYLTLLLFTGLRRTEAATLVWSDVDFDKRIIRVSAERTKTGKKLDLPMTDLVRDMLVARRAIGHERFVFPSVGKGGHLSEPKFHLRQVAAACGVYVAAHDLRRTFVTVAESCDISPIALKLLVNHAVGADMTARYAQLTTERLRGQAQRVCDRLKALCGIEAAAEGVLRFTDKNFFQ